MIAQESVQQQAERMVPLRVSSLPAVNRMSWEDGWVWIGADKMESHEDFSSLLNMFELYHFIV